jgi:hypothetical protein
MIWLLQFPAPVLGFATVAFVVALSVGGLLVFRKVVPHRRAAQDPAVPATRRAALKQCLAPSARDWVNFGCRRIPSPPM